MDTFYSVFWMSSVLLNGVPGKPFKCKRGVRQGDHLSPLLFVLAADLLQTLINDACSRGSLSHPLGPNFGGDYPIIQYADDTLMVLPADVDQVTFLKQLLHDFACPSGLKVNFSKSFLIPMNIEQSEAQDLVDALSCQIGAMPFTYLGLPLGTTWHTVQEWLPLLNRIERRLMGLSTFLSYAGRLIIVNLVLSALPTFYLCMLKFPVWVIEQIDKYRMHYLWDKGDINRKGGCLVAWTKACRSKDQGGLGIIDPRTQNTALLLKYMHKFYNRVDLTWVHASISDQ